MRNDKRNYYEMMEQLVEYNCKASELLVSYLEEYSFARIDEMRREIHAVEHAADDAKHIVLRKLVREFVTPIGRDDILALVNIIDDITDAIDDVVIQLYIYGIDALPEGVAAMARLVATSTKAFQAAMAELHNFKCSQTLHSLIVQVNNIESDADEQHIESLHKLYANASYTPRELIGLREIYDRLESCCDLCEHGADVLENVVMNNI